MYYLCVGHSHLGAIQYCYENGRPSGAFDDIELEFVELHNVASFEYYHTRPDVLDTPILDAFSSIEAVRGEAPAAVFMTVGGSVQHTISMLNHEQPMDLIVPWRARAEVADDAVLIPYRMMERLLLEQSGWKLHLLSLMAKHFSCPKYFFQAPPPIASEEHLREYPGPQFERLVAERGFSPIGFRQKISEMHTKIYRDECDSGGVTFVPAPERALDGSGNLAVEAAAPDSIHASVVYGGYLIDQIRAIRDQVQEIQA